MSEIKILRQKIYRLFSYRIILNALVLIFTLIPSILVLTVSKSYITNYVMQRYISSYTGSIESEFSDNISSFI